MSSNTTIRKSGIIITAVGKPLEGCPKNLDEANAIEEKLNEGKEEDEPQWKFDCGFKLDYDGSILSINSRFYPPNTNYGSTWDGTVTVYFLGREVDNRKFDCATVEELKIKVEEYVADLGFKLRNSLNHTTD